MSAAADGEFKAPPVMRLYEKELPAVGDFVKCKYQALTETSAYVALLEYGNIEAMITFSELATRRVQSTSQLASVGREEVLMVQRVDTQKKYIDLTKKGVTPKDAAECEGKYKKSRAVLEILWQTAEQTGASIDMLMTQVAYPLYTQYGHAFDALEAAADTQGDPKAILGPLIDTQSRAYAKIVEIIKRKLKPRVYKLEAHVNVTCLSSRGVDAIKEALHAGQNATVNQVYKPAVGPEYPMPVVEITVVGPPLFLFRTQQTTKREAAIAALSTAISATKAAMEQRGGALTVEVEARDVGATAD